MCNELETFCAGLKANHSGLYSVDVVILKLWVLLVSSSS